MKITFDLKINGVTVKVIVPRFGYMMFYIDGKRISYAKFMYTDDPWIADIREHVFNVLENHNIDIL